MQIFDYKASQKSQTSILDSKTSVQKPIFVLSAGMALGLALREWRSSLAILIVDFQTFKPISCLQHRVAFQPFILKMLCHGVTASLYSKTRFP